MGFYERLLEHIEEDLIPDALEQVRAGYYIAAVTGVYRAFRRLQIKPEWNDDPVDWTQRIASPILDVMPAAGARLAVLSQDGAVDYPAIIGQIWDELAPRMTVWIRAHLGTDPGRLEVGAERSIHIRAGVEDAVSNDAADSLELAPLGDGTFKVEAETLQLGDGTVELLEEISTALGEVADVLGRLSVTHSAVAALTVNPLPGATLAALYSPAATTGANAASLTAAKDAIDAVKARLDDLRL